MYCTPQVTLTARKQHQCTYCAQQIQPGESYVRWYSVDDSGFTNKMHPECLAAIEADEGDGSWEYSPYSGERPTAP